MHNRDFWADPAQGNSRSAEWYGRSGKIEDDLIPEHAITGGYVLVFTATAVSATLAAVGVLGLLGWL